MFVGDRLDIIIFGATGFTGKRTIPQLTKLIKSENLSLTWGIAGRSKARLKDTLLEIHEETGEDYNKIPVIIADIDDKESIERMTASAKIIINIVGPYIFYGERVVAACLKSGTHHVDVSGEPQYMEFIQLRYHEAAKTRGIYLVSACGFDSIPVDLGIVFLQKNFYGTLNSVATYMYIRKDGGPYPGATTHFTTYESAIHAIAHYKQLRDIRSKLFREKLPAVDHKVETKWCGFFKNKYLEKWCTVYPGSDRSVSLRTQRYMFTACKQRPIQIQCYVGYDSFLHLLTTLIFSAIILVLSKLNFTRKLLLKHPKFFSGGFASHEGPSKQKQENTTFNVILLGRGWCEILLDPTDEFYEPPEKLGLARVSGKNPGYGATCLMLTMSAIMILTENDKMPDG
ncbi:hypothetical protein MML48_7g00001750 [Holotrichia oblita]|uniref:Uncharacterized protein n=1 Tax=Holotrichia oblita TaxID=644536 RepID=A0ACB9SU89_HOLOL|nr:hypothetical protein MML48_7g00001750 [Holotrichia oblita]